MRSKHSFTEIINGEETVELYRHLHEVITEDGMRLVMTQKIPFHVKPKASIILVHGFGQNRYTWTQTNRSMENYLVSHGYQTFNVELRGHGMSRANGSDYPENFEAYLFRDIPALLQAVKEISGDKKIFYIGHSLGATISYCVGASFQDDLAGIVAIAGPFHMGKGNLFMKYLGKSVTYIDHIVKLKNILPEAFYIDMIGILASNGLEIVDNPELVMPVNVWYPGTIEKDILLERIRKGFDRTSLNVVAMLAEWANYEKLYSQSTGEDYEEHILEIDIPISFVAGFDDYSVPPEAIEGAYEKVGSKDKEFKIFGHKDSIDKFGHIDLISGKLAPANTWKYVQEWLDRHI